MSTKGQSDPQGDRFRLSPSRPSMKAVVTTGIGGYDRLEYRDVPRPIPTSGEVLLQVLAAGVNNTEVNTRVGWYAAQVSESTGAAALAAEGGASGSLPGGWSGATPFPLIQGTDCCGRVVAVADGGDKRAIGSRVLVRPCMQMPGASAMDSVWMGCDFDGSFAQFVKVPASEVFPVQCNWSDAELASIPCAYGTAENLILRAGVSAVEHVLISGASGGVGTAAVQLAKRRGALVTAIAALPKFPALRSLGADRAIDRDADLVASLGENSVDLVIDSVGGSAFPDLLRVLRRGGRYASCGAIASPIVDLDLRTLYLKDLTLIGCTAWDRSVFPNLIGCIERGEIRPIIAKSFPLAQIAAAQHEFLQKKHVGKLILIPPAPAEQSAV
jgi:NADPH:quinone reductase-like Zn-dependent oxidoreductase